MSASKHKKNHQNETQKEELTTLSGGQGLHSGNRQTLLLFFLGGLLAMAMATFSFHIENPGLMQPLPGRARSAMPPAMPPAGTQSAGVPEMPPATTSSTEPMTGSMPPMGDAGTNNPMAEVRALMATLEQDPNNYDALLALGERVMDIQAWDRAKELFNRALLVKPDSTPPLNFLGIIDYNQGKYQSAVETFNMIVKKEPDAVPAHLNLGIIYWRHLDNPAAARTHLQAVLHSKTASEQAKQTARQELTALKESTEQK